MKHAVRTMLSLVLALAPRGSLANACAQTGPPFWGNDMHENKT